MSQAIMNLMGSIAGRGVATGGTKTTLVDTKRVFEADMLNGAMLRIIHLGTEYYRKITDTAASTLTFATLPGAQASAVWTVSAGVTITVSTVTDIAAGNDYTIVAALDTAINKPLAVAFADGVITVTLATGAGGASDDAKNTVTLVTAAIDALADFTAVAGGSGATVVGATSSPVAFTGGVDEVKPSSITHYEIEFPQATSLTGSLANGVTDALPVQLSGSILADETDKAATANTDILTDITATKTEMTTLMVATNTTGILKLEVDGSLNSLNGGVSLDTGKWYAFDIPILAASVYNLQLSVGATMQIKWIGGF